MNKINSQERIEDLEYIKERLERTTEFLWRYSLIKQDEGDHNEAKEAWELNGLSNLVLQEISDDLALRLYDLWMKELKNREEIKSK
ncbi:hypothetical protein ACWGXJ_02985 [Paenibacillus sp. S33]